MVAKRRAGTVIAGLSGLAAALLVLAAARATPDEATATDAKVRAFLDASRGSWHDLNVPYEDGELLHRARPEAPLPHDPRDRDLDRPLHGLAGLGRGEDGRQGHDARDRRAPARHAPAQLREGGRRAYVDARLGDAHELVKSLPGPFDFVFSDADKDWYLQYFLDLDPKTRVGGCFTAHNVLRSGGGGAAAFLEYVKKLPDYETTVEAGSGEGISISCKRR